jgi:hypothetical protein
MSFSFQFHIVLFGTVLSRSCAETRLVISDLLKFNTRRGFRSVVIFEMLFASFHIICGKLHSFQRPRSGSLDADVSILKVMFRLTRGKRQDSHEGEYFERKTLTLIGPRPPFGFSPFIIY